MSKSDLEDEFERQLVLVGAPPFEREYWFAKELGRRWRFDFCWRQQKLAVEVEGGTWSRGRHTRGSGFEKDCEKYNTAALLGWIVLRFPGSMVKDGRALDYTEKMLNSLTADSKAP